MNKPKQRRIGCRQQRKRKFRITYDVNVETWINEEVSHGEIIRNERKVSQCPLPRETSANGEINELCYLPKTPKRLIDPDVNQETSKQLSHSLLRFMKWQTSRYSWVEYTEPFLMTTGTSSTAERTVSLFWESTVSYRLTFNRKFLDLPVFTFTPYATPKVTKSGQRCKFVIQIHKFTFKIDTISINLLFECVKIVEFNFNSHVFLVMYQDVRFLNKKERRQFVISSVSERDWKREHRLELLIVSIFQMQVKFSKVCSPFCSTAGTVSKKILMGDTQNFLQDVKRNINALCVICGWCMFELRSRPMRISLLRIWSYWCR